MVQMVDTILEQQSAHVGPELIPTQIIDGVEETEQLRRVILDQTEITPAAQEVMYILNLAILQVHLLRRLPRLVSI